MGWLSKLFGDTREEGLPLYNAVVARGRAEHWYLDGGVPDTVDGRFDMIAAVLAVVMMRLEQEPAGARLSVAVTERFVDDMDGQLRQIGIGDIVVGKHVGKMMGMLGGRLAAYRDGLAAGDLAPALARNLYRGRPPSPEAVDHAARHLNALRDQLAATSIDALAAGDQP